MKPHHIDAYIAYDLQKVESYRDLIDLILKHEGEDGYERMVNQTREDIEMLLIPDEQKRELLSLLPSHSSR